MCLYDTIESNFSKQKRCNKMRYCDTNINNELFKNDDRYYKGIIVGNMICRKLCPLFLLSKQIIGDSETITCKVNLIEKEKEFLGVSYESN